MQSHEEALRDVEHPVQYLGQVQGLAVAEGEDGPLLFVHGEDQSAAALILDAEVTDGLARAGVEIEAALEGE